METELVYTIIGNYSIRQVEWKISEDRPKEDCSKCHNAKMGTILIKGANFPSKWICAECLVNMAKTKGV